MENFKEICSHIDHTQLNQTAVPDDIKKLCDEAAAGGAASVCIPPCYVSLAADYLNGRIPVCTVIGFPNGYSTKAAKVFEAAEAVSSGAAEVDMVINLGMVKSGNLEGVLDEIRAVKAAASGAILKVIIETCFLTEDEKKKLCDIVREAGAEYIKTSTGFGSAGATPEDVALMAECLKGSSVKIKAAGGIRTTEAAEEYLKLGADRLGSSAILRK